MDVFVMFAASTRDGATWKIIEGLGTGLLTESAGEERE
jgi:hypothetical protein